MFLWKKGSFVNCWLLVVSCSLLVASCSLLPTTYYLLLTTHYLLPTTHYLSPTPYPLIKVAIGDENRLREVVLLDGFPILGRVGGVTRDGF
jgi:hypothetical protein